MHVRPAAGGELKMKRRLGVAACRQGRGPQGGWDDSPAARRRRHRAATAMLSTTAAPSDARRRARRDGGGWVVASSVNIENIKGFSFYPNPVNNRLTIKSSEVITKIEVYNLLVQKIIRKKLNQELYINDLDLSELSTGNYLIKVYADNKIKTFRIIKN